MRKRIKTSLGEELEFDVDSKGVWIEFNCDEQGLTLTRENLEDLLKEVKAQKPTK